MNKRTFIDFSHNFSDRVTQLIDKTKVHLLRVCQERVKKGVLNSRLDLIGEHCIH